MLALLQAAAGVVVAARLARGRERHPPLRPQPVTGRVSVVVPARDEAERIGPCLDALRGTGAEVIVVDDESGDGTAEIAAAAGARVVRGTPPPKGWVGKPWALQQGLEAATGDVVVSLDADVRPGPGLVGAMAGLAGPRTWATAGLRFESDGAAERWLHASLLATLVHRTGPADAERPARVLANGQCTAVRREAFLATGGYAVSVGSLTDDVALARALAARGWTVAFRDGTALGTVDMHDGVADVWREWGRSIALADAGPRTQLAGDLAAVWLTMALPLVRVVRRRPTAVDRALLALRLAVLVALRGTYTRRGAPFWLSPLADPLAAVRLTLSAARPSRAWRGRTYGS